MLAHPEAPTAHIKPEATSAPALFHFLLTTSRLYRWPKFTTAIVPPPNSPRLQLRLTHALLRDSLTSPLAVATAISAVCHHSGCHSHRDAPPSWLASPAASPSFLYLVLASLRCHDADRFLHFNYRAPDSPEHVLVAWFASPPSPPPLASHSDSPLLQPLGHASHGVFYYRGHYNIIAAKLHLRRCAAMAVAKLAMTPNLFNWQCR